MECAPEVFGLVHLLPELCPQPLSSRATAARRGHPCFQRQVTSDPSPGLTTVQVVEMPVSSSDEGQENIASVWSDLERDSVRVSDRPPDGMKGKPRPPAFPAAFPVPGTSSGELGRSQWASGWRGRAPLGPVLSSRPWGGPLCLHKSSGLFLGLGPRRSSLVTENVQRGRHGRDRLSAGLRAECLCSE